MYIDANFTMCICDQRLVLYIGHGRKMLIFLILIIMTKHTLSQEVYNLTEYKWRQENDNFDFIVGISVRDVPVCTGVVIASNIVLTSVNPLIGYYKLKKSEDALITNENIKVHVIYKEWDRNYAVKAIYAYPQFLSCTGSQYPEMDLFSKECPYTPTHDLMTVTTELNVTHSEWLKSTIPYRYPFPINLYISQRIRIVDDGTFTIAGFGYIDRLHVKQNCELEAVDYRVRHVLVNCDEWVPKHWGYFICLLNIEDFVGIDSGASLLHNGIFIGLGSFALLRGNESILVFTDVRKYKSFFFNTKGYPIGTIF